MYIILLQPYKNKTILKLVQYNSDFSLLIESKIEYKIDLLSWDNNNIVFLIYILILTFGINLYSIL